MAMCGSQCQTKSKTALPVKTGGAVSHNGSARDDDGSVLLRRRSRRAIKPLLR
jgi:hypothetical protein